MLASIASAIALIPGGGSTVAAAASAFGYLIRCTACLKILGVAALVGWTAWHVHSADAAHCDARIADNRSKAAAAAGERDATIEQQLEKNFKPKLAELQKQSDERKLQADKYEKRIVDLLSKQAAGGKPVSAGCQLGDRADRVRRPR